MVGESNASIVTPGNGVSRLQCGYCSVMQLSPPGSISVARPHSRSIRPPKGHLTVTY